MNRFEFREKVTAENQYQAPSPCFVWAKDLEEAWEKLAEKKGRTAPQRYNFHSKNLKQRTN